MESTENMKEEQTETDIDAVAAFVRLDDSREVCVLAFTRVEQPWGEIENREPSVSEMAVAMEAMGARDYSFEPTLPVELPRQ